MTALPTFFIIGAAKAGTTSLHRYLDQHPEIQMSAVKEPDFFAGPENGLPFPPRHISDRSEYERLFDPSFSARGEASPSYSSAPRRKGVPSRIKELVPAAKFIYLVRDPVQRTISHYRHAFANGRERRPISEACNDLDNPRSYLTSHSLYGQQLELYFEHFPVDRITVVDHIDLLQNRGPTLKDIFRFLDTDDTFSSSEFDLEHWRTDERRVIPHQWYSLMGHTASRAAWIPVPVRHFLRRSAERILYPQLNPAEPDAATLARLRSFYAPDVEKLRKLTGHGFSTWSI